MRYRILDPNDDYTFGRRNAFYTDVEAVAQAIKTRLRLLKGEWWENVLDGTPLFEEAAGRFFSVINDVSQVDLVFAERIMGTPGVSSITAFDSELNPNTRTYTASITINTMYDREIQIDVSSAGGDAVSVALKGGRDGGVF